MKGLAFAVAASLMAAPAATAPGGIPDYGEGYSFERDAAPLLPVCLKVYLANLTGASMVVPAEVKAMSAPEKRRVAELCVFFMAGAVAHEELIKLGGKATPI